MQTSVKTGHVTTGQQYRYGNLLTAVQNWLPAVGLSAVLIPPARTPARPARAKYFFLRNVQTDSGVHQASHSMFSGPDIYHAPQSSTEAGSEWSHTSTPHIRLQAENRDKFTFYLLVKAEGPSEK
jgi:hypothetical protein